MGPEDIYEVGQFDLFDGGNGVNFCCFISAYSLT